MNWFGLAFWGIFLIVGPAQMIGQCDSIAIETGVSLTSCPGQSVDFNGISLFAGDQDTFYFTTPQGCDSIVIVSVNAAPLDTTFLTITTCPEDLAFYNGIPLAVGDSAWVNLTSAIGCDSLVIVQVESVNLDTGLVEFAVCAGDSVTYGGHTVMAGDTQVVSINFSDGCDSTILVSVAIIPADTTLVELETCPTGLVDYQGYTLAAGDILTLELQNQFGCDSFVFVSVSAVELDTTLVELAACPGDYAFFAGQAILAGDAQFVAVNYANGCDSIFLVTVSVLPADSTFLEVEICGDETIDLYGSTLAPGDQKTVLYSNQWGCDSILIISVTATPPISFTTKTDPTCPAAADGVITITTIAGEGPFLCALDNDPFQATSIFPNLKSGLYNVRVMDTQGCVEKRAVQVPEREKLDIHAEDQLLPCGSPFITLRPRVLSHAGEVQWHWPDGSTNNWMLVQEVGTIHFSVSDECSEEDLSVSVIWDEGRPVDPFFLPNAFSPNGDGINDQLSVYPADGASFLSFEWQVFDRWGAQLFRTSDPAESWDGNYQRNMMNPGVYAYFLKAEVEVCGRVEQVFREGDVTLIR